MHSVREIAVLLALAIAPCPALGQAILVDGFEGSPMWATVFEQRHGAVFPSAIGQSDGRYAVNRWRGASRAEIVVAYLLRRVEN